MQTLLISLGAVAIAEIGDKTQLLSLILAARYRKPWPIIAGILLATLLNHFLAAWFGTLVAQWLPPWALKWLLVASFVAVALWALKPDRVDDAEARRGAGYGAFLAACIAFFLAEIGDKTQVATIVLAAQYQPLWQVVCGTTLGMLLANVPVVFAGAKLADRIPMVWARRVAAGLFLLLALVVALRPLA
jgi:Ca2+/H+ antiporter, TMEM165/GDT1 family